LKQVVQNYNNGELSIAEVPAPVCRPGGVLVRSAYSLVSAGTERMKVSQARMNIVEKARARPDKVKQVIQSVQQTGLAATVNKVRERLAALTPLGYSLAGVVEEVGAGLDEFQVGDRVACAGEGIACHAEFVFAPRNLCVKVPDGVDLSDAAFATVGAIAMNGVRQAHVALGDNVLVIGLGLVGLLGVQILKAAGCRVIGVDVDPAKLDLARACGADLALPRDSNALEQTILDATGGLGVDAAYIAASTKSSDPMQLAGHVARDRGTVVVVGMVPVEADWQTYYHKELSVVMSRSYGPGRYDPQYERKGIDYPVGYVRWTQRRNLEEFLRLIAAGRVRPGLLSPRTFKFADAPEAYQELHAGGHAVGMLFAYPADAPLTRAVPLPRAKLDARPAGDTVGIGLIGAGNFSTGTLIPALKRQPTVRLRAICSAGGLSAASAGQRHGFEVAASDYHELLGDEQLDAVVIATRHDTHARFAAAALRAGKHVFVEKPLALNQEQLDEVIAAQRESGRILMPGFNRRFSPLSIAVRDHFAGRESPLVVTCRVNAGSLKADSWYQDSEEGGWRIVSEGCHFIDLIQYFCGAVPVRVHAQMVGGTAAGQQHDNCIVTLEMADGSLGTVIYLANGDPHFEKERIEVFGQGRVAVIENWQRARLTAGGKTRKRAGGTSGKGHAAELEAFVKAVRAGEAPPLPFDSAVATTLATFAVERSLQAGQSVDLASLTAESGGTRLDPDGDPA
jgi:predicted dehydrogenase/threonine dehydrogenase-like Zn-dependent dehydrogenase